MVFDVITCEELKSRVHYDPDTGVFTWIWLPNKAQRVKIGDIAGYVNKLGYSQLMIDRKTYKSHRLAWLYVYGSFPILFLDHIDGNPTNNRISNLRECTNAENLKNVGITNQNTSGFKGVGWYKPLNKWRSQASIDDKLHHIGYFTTPEEASEAYQKFAKEHHGEFYRDTTK